MRNFIEFYLLGDKKGLEGLKLVNLHQTWRVPVMVKNILKSELEIGLYQKSLNLQGLPKFIAGQVTHTFCCFLGKCVP